MTRPVGAIGAVDLAAAALDALRGGEAVAAVTVVGPPRAAGGPGAAAPPPELGRRMLVWRGTAAGTLGDLRLDERAAELARAALDGRVAAATHRVSVEGTELELFVETHAAPPELVIVGAGHIARPLCRIGALLGFSVTVLDDRPEFATRERFPEADRVIRADFSDPFRDVALGPGSHLVLVTRGHKYDFDALAIVLRMQEQPAYIGMVGSRRRVRAALRALAEEGVARERLQAVHAPVGLDIGAETPEEIAVAIAAEIIRLRRGGTAVPLRDRARVVERWLAGGE